MKFNNFNLHPKILKAVTDAGYTEPTGIQLKAIPKITNNFDIRASAQTGTGKTAAFLLPALNRLVSPSKKPGKGPRLLILVPTRELAMQIAVQAEKYSKYLHRVKTVCVVGGVPYHTQTRKISRPYDILIATPGRLIDFIDQGKMDFSRLEMLVLDEADRMLDMGFVEPVEQIVAQTPEDRQTLLFSATLQGSVMKFSEKLLNKPMDIVVHAEHEKHDHIEQKLHYVDNRKHKTRLLDHILKQDDVAYTIVFTSTKRQADQLVKTLQQKEHHAAALHGDMSQRQRSRTVMQLRKGRINILVATDVAARGIDVKSITHVINFDLPRHHEDYVHRIGRTGRAGSMGIALSFADPHDADLVKKIEKFTGQPIEVIEIPGFESSPIAKKSPKPKNRRSSRLGARRKYKSAGKSAKKAGERRNFKSAGKRKSNSAGKKSPKRRASRSKNSTK